MKLRGVLAVVGMWIFIGVCVWQPWVPVAVASILGVAAFSALVYISATG